MLKALQYLKHVAHVEIVLCPDVVMAAHKFQTSRKLLFDRPVEVTSKSKARS